MMVGTMLAAPGTCPVCGDDCARTHGFNGVTLTERYACGSCGDTVYIASRVAA